MKTLKILAAAFLIGSFAIDQALAIEKSEKWENTHNPNMSKVLAHQIKFPEIQDMSEAQGNVQVVFNIDDNKQLNIIKIKSTNAVLVKHVTEQMKKLNSLNDFQSGYYSINFIFQYVK